MFKKPIIEFPYQMFCLSFTFIFSFISLFAFLSSIVSVRLNKSAIKKRKKGQNFKEWLLFSRFKDVIPKFWRFFYIIVSVIDFLGILICILLNIFDASLKTSTIMVLFICCFDVILMGLHSIIFWMPNDRFSNKAIKKWFGKKKK